MARERGGLTIGELSRRTNVPVKTLRYYSDEGLLPPAGRTRSRYRVYGDDAVQRVELIRSLREAGLGIDRIRAVLGRELSLAAALRLQLAVVESHLASLKQVASALRAALRSEPTEQDIRRLCAVTRLSNEERRQVIERFYDAVSEGSHMDAGWKKTMVEASAPTLPDDPTPEQIDAWIELAEIVNDPSFLESMKSSVKETWTADFDHVAYKKAAETMMSESKGLSPEDPRAKEVVERCLAGFAKASNQEPDEAFRLGLRRRYETMDPRASRYWQLVAILKGQKPKDDSSGEWKWFAAASKHHFP
jgi:DNA-binding transcriptional MerR regulator